MEMDGENSSRGSPLPAEIGQELMCIMLLSYTPEGHSYLLLFGELIKAEVRLGDC